MKMLKIIAEESSETIEYITRVEAWAATESKPPGVRKMWQAWRDVGGDITLKTFTTLLKRAEKARLAIRVAAWRSLIKTSSNKQED